MKRIDIKSVLMIAAVGIVSTGCYKMQKDFEYVQTPLDPNVNKTAKEYILSRADNVTPGSVDTIFRWMKKAIEYAEIDWAEYEKPNRTYILLHTNAVRTLTSNVITGGFFFDYPILVKDANGNQLPSVINPSLDSTRIPTTWEEYSKQTVKNYLLSLIIDGKYTFENLGVPNTTVQTLLPPNTVAGDDSKLSYVVVQNDPNPDPTANGSILMIKGQGKGFDQQGKLNFRVVNNSNSPLRVNDKIDVRTGGIIATNGPMHVLDKTVHPFRYSYQ